MQQLLRHGRIASGLMQCHSFRPADGVRRLDSGFDLSAKNLSKQTQVRS
jgi:hypothetical protein